MHNIFIWIPSTHTHMHTHSNGMCYRFSNMCCLCSLAKKWTKTNEKSVASQYIETQSELKCKISMSIIYHDIQNYRNIALPSCPSLLPKLHVSTCMNCGHHQNCYQMFDAKKFWSTAWVCIIIFNLLPHLLRSQCDAFCLVGSSLVNTTVNAHLW